MYRPPAFAVDDPAMLRDFIRANPFAVVMLAQADRVAIAYAPVVLDRDGQRLRFHLAAGNPVARAADGARLRLSFLGAHAYVSPDWYRSQGMVPTWNYSAVEAEGIARKTDVAELRALLDELSAAEEALLLPKAPWIADKVGEARMAALLNAIAGFEVTLESFAGKFKLSQNLKPEDFAGALDGLEARGDAAGAAVAAQMRKTRKT
ncbi:MAG: FMN-binding negative transcriptional regulator [Rhizomicrobium sp.]